MNPAIELFRGIAAWMVLTSHYAIFFTTEHTILNFFWTGVDFFFVISGFVFAKMIYVGQVAIIPYWIRRFFRIYPLYITSLILYYFFTPEHAEKLTFFIKHLFFLQTTHSAQEAFFFNAAYWSLPVEMEFYFIVPFLALFNRKWHHFIPFLFIVLLFVSFAITSHATNLNQPNIYTILRFHLPTTLMEFMVGIILYKVYSRYQRKILAWWIHVSIFSIGLLILSSLALFFIKYGDVGLNQYLFIKTYFNLFCAIGYAFILLPFLFLMTERKLHPFSFYLLMGNMSYGVYLFHNLIPKILHSYNYQLTGWEAYLICSGLVILLSLFFHYLIEHPLRIFGRNWAKNTS